MTAPSAPSRSESADADSFLVLAIRESYGHPEPCARCSAPTRWRLDCDPDAENEPRCPECCAKVLTLLCELDAYIAASA